MRSERAWGYLAAMFVLGMVWILWPDQQTRRAMREHIVRVAVQDEIPMEQARSEARAIEAEGNRLTAAGRYPAETYLAHLKRLKYLQKHVRVMCGFCTEGQFGGDITYNPLISRLANSFFSGTKQQELEFQRFAALRDADREFEAISNFVPEETKWHLGPLWRYLLRVYPLTVILALFYHICILSYRRRSVLAELVAPDRLFKAAVLWPIRFWYETREPREQFIRASRAIGQAMAYAFAGALCMVPGSAQGQASKDKQGKKPGHSLQFDLRNTRFVGEGGPPNPNLFGRLTFNSRKLVLENITTITPKLGRWSSEFVAGPALLNNSRGRINAVVGASCDNTGTTRLMMGAQVFIPWRHGVVAVPVIRLERDLEVKTFTVAFATNPTIRIGESGWRSRVALAPDVLIRKTGGKPLVWNAGAGLRFNLWRRDHLEVGVLRNFLGQTQLRGRMILNFVF